MEIGVLVSWFGVDIILPDFSAIQWLVVVMASISLSCGLASAWIDNGRLKGFVTVTSFATAGTVLIVTMSDAFDKAPC